MNCEFCQKPTHIWFDCKDKPAGWRPARLATKSENICKPRLAKTGTSVVSISPALSAVTSEVAGEGLSQTSSTLVNGNAGSIPAAAEPKFKDRHSPGYMKKYMKEWRARRRLK